jgi:hypothetical protein
MRSKKTLILVFCAVFAVSWLTALATFQQQSQKANADGVVKEQATVIQDGQMTEKQKQHAKLFKHSGPKLRDIVESQPGDIEVVDTVGYSIRLPKEIPAKPVFQSAVCNADAVVAGTILSKSSQLTEQENFVFTDYEVKVEEIIKNNSPSPIQTNTITATRDGGAVQLGNRTYRATKEDFEPPMIGHQYLFFLKFIPSTGSYLAYGNGTFQLDDSKILALGPASRKELAHSPANDSSSFLTEIRSFAKADCRNH